MPDLKDVHHILIGSHQYFAYAVNAEILRFNWPNGNDLWLTTVYNGDIDKIFSAGGENTFIKIDNNTGYAYGALDAINAGLDFANLGYRDIIVVTNFDCFFFSQEKYMKLIEDFSNSGKPFSAGYLLPHEVPMTDCMLFQKDFLKKILPIEPKVYEPRLDMKLLKDKYADTELKFNNVEEWVLNSLYSAGSPAENWYPMQRDGEPRFRYTDCYGFGHLHEGTDVRTYMNMHNINRGNHVNVVLDPQQEDTIANDQIRSTMERLKLNV